MPVASSTAACQRAVEREERAATDGVLDISTILQLFFQSGTSQQYSFYKLRL